MYYAAFLRGVNLARARRLSMPELRKALSAAGQTGVRTHLQSGNLVVDADEGHESLARRISDVIEEAFGLTIRVVVRDRDEMRSILASNPYAEAADRDPTRVHVVFLGPEVPAGSWPDLDPTSFGPEGFQRGPGVLYLHLPHGMARARLPGELEKAARGVVTTTTRNWRTVEAVGAMMEI